MSEANRDSDLARWGRPLRKRSRGPKAQLAPADPGFVGPVGDDLPPGGAATIVRRSPAPVAVEPAPARPRLEPDESDFFLRDLVVHMARGIVDHADAVSVEILRPGDDSEFELRVHREDLGHVIGKQGRTARSLRLALGAAAARRGRRAGLEIAD